MTKYKCGHKCDTIIMNTTFMSIAYYIDWMNSVGFDGDKSKCFDCYINELHTHNR